MPVFTWQGVGPRGETLRGEMEAASREAVVTRLRTQRIRAPAGTNPREGPVAINGNYYPWSGR